MNKILSLVLLILLSLPISVRAVDDNMIELETELPEISLIEQETTLAETEIDKKIMKKPIGRRALAKKFLFAMGGVAISSMAIFLMLSIYNKIRENCQKPTSITNDDMSLVTSNNLDDAIKVFLKKTNW